MSDNGETVMVMHKRGGVVSAEVDAGMVLPVEAVVILQDGSGVQIAARVASTHARSDPTWSRSSRRDLLVESSHQDDDAALASVVEVWFVDPAGETRLGDVVVGDDVAQSDGHGWGALGLPLGGETRLSRCALGDDDVGAALASVGHRLTVESVSHDVMPGDAITVEGESVLVIAIDRRNDRLTIRSYDGEEREVAFRQTILEAG